MAVEISRFRDVLDSKYQPADLVKVAEQCDNLTSEQQQQLTQLLQKHEPLFDGSLGKMKSEPYDIQLKENAKPYHAKPFPIPHAHEAKLRAEVQRLCDIGVLTKVNDSEWGAPTWVIPKKDGNTVRFLSDFRELNKCIKRKPYPIPKVQDMLLKLEGFRYATAIDLNMGYYNILLTPESSRLCTIVLPWGKYSYTSLPMGLATSPDIFQEKMNNLFVGLEHVRVYIDDILCITKGTWQDHVTKLDQVLQRLQDAGMKVNATKSSFAREKLDYLGYTISQKGIAPISKKVDAIRNIAPPKTRKQLRSFLGMVLLAYPDFSKLFEIHTDASDSQLGTVVAQEGQPIAFYSRKLNPAQNRYNTTTCHSRNPKRISKHSSRIRSSRIYRSQEPHL